ncbi:MAG: DUF4153 domain-containing protein [Synergistaceae bacterium]|nr:DUF4153 domain-containing protein [Synergistaceae bacterium]
MYNTDKKRYFWVGSTALLQGFLLWVNFSAQTVVPFFGDLVGMGAQTQILTAAAGQNMYSFIPLSIIVIIPITLWLSQDHWGRRLARFIGGLFVVLILFRLYWLWSVMPASGVVIPAPASNTNFAAICIAVFFMLPYFQCRIASWSWHIPYSEIFFQFCRNVFLLFQAAVATGLFWLLLHISAGLFEITGFKALSVYIFDPLIFCILTSFVVAVSITLGLKRPGIDSVGRWILSILAWLLPPFAVVSILFICYLPFSGLKPLLDTGQASTLMLLLQISLICLANAAWLDGSRVPFAISINVAAKAGLLTLPFYSALCIYSLSLRIRQYGWSVDRIEAAAMLLIIGAWGIGYAAMIIAKKWPKTIGNVNFVVILIFCALITLMNTPVLDTRRLTANNQVARLKDGSIKPFDFDFRYMRFNLGRYGYEALLSLKELKGSVGAVRISMKADEALKMKLEERDMLRIPTERDRTLMLEVADIIPPGRYISEKIIGQIVEKWGKDELSFLKGERNSRFSFILGSFVGEKASGGKDLIFVTPFGMVLYEIISDDVLKYSGVLLLDKNQ